MAEAKKSKMGLILGVVAVVVIGAIIAFVLMKKPKPVEKQTEKDTKKGNCKTVVPEEEYNRRLQANIVSISENQQWVADITADLKNANSPYAGLTLEKAIELAAIKSLAEFGICKE